MHRRRLAGYALTRYIGRGTMGELWEARDPAGVTVAVKALYPQLARDNSVTLRFIRQRESLTAVRHPNVVSVHDVVQHHGELGVVSDYVQGHSLRQVVRARGVLPPHDIATIGAAISDGLAAIHAHGLLHGDLKPENVLMQQAPNAAPTTKLSDFGIGPLATLGDSHTPATLRSETLPYFAPEILDHDEPQPASDLYALGVVLYECAIGVRPFDWRTSTDAIEAARSETPVRPEGVPTALWGVIAALLAKDPGQRPACAAETAARLREIAPQLEGVPAALLHIVPPGAAVAGGVPGIPVTAVGAGTDAAPGDSGQATVGDSAPEGSAKTTAIGAAALTAAAAAAATTAGDRDGPTGTTTGGVSTGPNSDKATPPPRGRKAAIGLAAAAVLALGGISAAMVFGPGDDSAELASGSPAGPPQWLPGQTSATSGEAVASGSPTATRSTSAATLSATSAWTPAAAAAVPARGAVAAAAGRRGPTAPAPDATTVTQANAKTTPMTTPWTPSSGAATAVPVSTVTVPASTTVPQAPEPPTTRPAAVPVRATVTPSSTATRPTSTSTWPVSSGSDEAVLTAADDPTYPSRQEPSNDSPDRPRDVDRDTDRDAVRDSSSRSRSDVRRPRDRSDSRSDAGRSRGRSDSRSDAGRSQGRSDSRSDAGRSQDRSDSRSDRRHRDHHHFRYRLA